MFHRLKRTAISFLAVLAAFGVYRVAAVPFIDPPVVVKRVPKGERSETASLLQLNRLGPYLKYFPEGAWERDNPMVLESDTVKAVVKDYKIGDGKDLPRNCMELRPCTMLVLPDGEVEGPESRRRVIIMRSEENQRAILQFENDIDLSRAQMGKLTGAEINGAVLIYSAATRPDGGDDLEVHARDIKMTGNDVVSDNPVQFRFGPSYGSGRDMRIKLLPAQQTGAASIGPSVSGIQDFTLLREVQMHLQPNGAGIMPGDEQVARRPADNNKPVDITCTGPFTFDMVNYVAEFHDNFVAQRPNDIGEADQITGGVLSILFAEKEQTPAEKAAKKAAAQAQADAPPANQQRAPRLVPKRITAVGNPVVAHAPSNGVHATGNKMEFDIGTRQISLEATKGSEPVFLNIRDLKSATGRELKAQAQTLNYLPAPEGHLLGQLHSQGPGRLQATPMDNSADQINARWLDVLDLRPENDKHLLSITGKAHVDYTSQGQIDASEIYLWLYELPTGAVAALPARAGANAGSSSLMNQVRSRVRPDGLLARGQVKFDSPQIQGDVEELRTQFRVAAADGIGQQPRGDSGGAFRDPNRPRTVHDARPRQPAQQPDKYNVRCRVLQTGLVFNGAHNALDFAVSTDGVEFDQFPEHAGEPSPLSIRSNWLKVERANAPDTQVTVLGKPEAGQPAVIVAQGMTMRGGNFNLDCGVNRMWIEGPGSMHMEPQPRPAGQGQPVPAVNGVRQSSPLANNGPLDIDWQERMDFDGRTVRFVRGVVAKQTTARPEQTDEQSIRNELLEVTLREPVDFKNAGRRQQRPEIEMVVARGKSLLENLSFKQGNPISVDRIDLTDLVMNQVTGETRSQGPGIAKSWHYGRRPQFTTPGGLPGGRTHTVAATQGDAPADENQITYSQVEFQNGIHGNILEGYRQINFLDRVRGIYGAVQDWRTELNDEEPQPGKMVLHCDRLGVTVLPPDASGKTKTQIDTEGRTQIDGMGEEGQIYSAYGHTLTYDQAKDFLVLKGDGRNPAHVEQQERIGAPKQVTELMSIQGSPSKGNFQGYIQQGSGSIAAPSMQPPRAVAPPMQPAVRQP